MRYIKSAYSLKNISIYNDYVTFDNNYLTNKKPYKRKLIQGRYFVFDGFLYQIRFDGIRQIGILEGFYKDVYITLFLDKYEWREGRKYKRRKIRLFLNRNKNKLEYIGLRQDIY